MKLITLLVLAAAAFAQPQAPKAVPGEDLPLRAMREEMERARLLRTAGLDLPYFIEYKLEDQYSYSIGASLGGLRSGILQRLTSVCRRPTMACSRLAPRATHAQVVQWLLDVTSRIICRRTACIVGGNLDPYVTHQFNRNSPITVKQSGR